MRKATWLSAPSQAVVSNFSSRAPPHREGRSYVQSITSPALASASGAFIAEAGIYRMVHIVKILICPCPLQRAFGCQTHIGEDTAFAASPFGTPMKRRPPSEKRRNLAKLLLFFCHAIADLKILIATGAMIPYHAISTTIGRCGWIAE